MRRNRFPQKKTVFCSFGYVDYILLASSIAIALGEELSSNDLNILATFFAVLSDELALVSAVESSCSGDGDDETFVAPVPDVAITTRHIKQKKCNNFKKKKKIIRRKVIRNKTLN